jgi:alpha-L-rhamnosidase
MSRFRRVADEEISERNRAMAQRSVHRRAAATLSLLAVLATAATSAQNAADPLKSGFKNPPQAARPRVWWHWMSGNVSQQGAELDLAWMKRVGIGGVHTFSGSIQEPSVVNPPVPFMSDAWKDVFRRTTEEARKSGMEVTIAGSPGWSETGGTWVTPEEAMKKYVWSETQVEGGKPFSGKLLKPPSVTGPFQGVRLKRTGPAPSDLTHDVYADSVVVAYRTPKAELAQQGVRYSSSSTQLDVSKLTAGILDSPASLAPSSDGKELWIQANYDAPTTIAAVTVGLASRADLDVQVSDDGSAFRTILHVIADMVEHPEPEQTFSFPSVQTRIVRVVFTPEAPPTLPGLSKFSWARASRPESVSLSHISFHSAGRVNRFEAKAGFVPTVDFAASPTPEIGADSIINSSEVVDLTNRLRSDDTLDWTPPPGHWIILRIGYSLTGQTNGPAEAASTGLEVDKLDAALVRKYMEHYLELYSAATDGKLGDSGVQNVLTDSWEAGVQNWTPTILAQFKARRGYDPTPYLPVLAGRVVNGAQKSDRFIWDFHRTLKEMLAENHYGTLAEVLHEHKMGYYTEAQGDTPRAIGDGMTMKSRADIPTGEFWYRNFATDEGQPPLKADLEESASTAHVYGKPLAAAESLTVAAFTDPWAFSPAMLKPVIDEIFAHGINRILMHESHHQPFVDKKPGLEMGIFGQYFNRNDTWAEQAGPWVDYIARTSYLLQQGKSVADVGYFYGEDRNLTEIFLHRFNTAVPSGYHYDYINREALLTLLSVRDGKLVTPSGMSYRLLFLPAYVDHLTLTALRKIRDLVSAGAVVAGPKPVGGAVPSATSAHNFGKGKVYTSGDLSDVLRAEGVVPDIDVTRPERDTNIMTLHRHLADRDIYFVSNQLDRPEDVTVTCRVYGMAPEIWHATDGRTEAVSYRSSQNGVSIPLHLEPEEAVFVVFHKSATRSRTLPNITTAVLQTLGGPWNLAFEPGWGAPKDMTSADLSPWNESQDASVKYFSGQATYTRTFTAPESWFKNGKRLFLDLGEVRELAEISVNGSRGQIVWHRPYRIDMTGEIKPGENSLAITITNLWPNRLIGDKQPGADKFTFAPQSPYKPDSPLLRSGLMGPVEILSESSQ